jgi:predicted DNA-binding mobile mystery protein A
MPVAAKALRLRQLDQRLHNLQALTQPPPHGWIRTIREALDMSATQLARRLGIAHSSVDALERREVLGTVTLDSLARAAHALDCELVYAVVPRGSLAAIRERRARSLAQRQLSRVAHSMALEDQAVSREEQATQEKELVDELLATWPRTFWDDRPGASRKT